MPVEYSYNADAKIIHANPHGELTLPEIRAFFEELTKDDAVVEGAIEVVHFERVEDFVFSSNEARVNIGMLDGLRDSKRVKATIFVAKGALQYGISRMLQTLYEIHDAEYPTRVVASDEELHDAIRSMTRLP
jgi:hypothetical protein